MSKIVLGTRATTLAKVQTQEVADALKAAKPDLEIEIKEFSTVGDETPGPIGGIGVTGVFVKQLEEALLAKEIDMAVHSAKDVPTAIPEGLAIGAWTKRRTVKEALITRNGEASIEALPAGAKIGTASARRRILVLEKRKDLEIVTLRGSVETRLAKLDAGEIDATILAIAGLERLGLKDRIAAVLSDDEFIPAPGQGALAVQVRTGEFAEECAALNHTDTQLAIECERTFLTICNAGCEAPLGVTAVVVERELFVKGIIGDLAGAVTFRSGRNGPKSMPPLNGKMLAQMMLAMGGQQVLDKWRADRDAAKAEQAEG